RVQLAKILVSPEFSKSPRLRELLQLIVEESLGGAEESLSTADLVLALFGEYEPTEHSKVRLRVTSNRLRKRLEQYYTNSDPDAALLIKLRPGSYVAKFAYRDAVRSTPRHETADPNTQSPCSLPYLYTSAPRPVVTVEPVRVFGVDEKASFVAANLTEEIVTTFSNSIWITIVDATRHRADVADLATLQSQLPRHFFTFECAVRRQDVGLRMIARVTDCMTGQIIWREAFDWHIGQLMHIDDIKGLAVKFRDCVVNRLYGVVLRNLRARIAESKSVSPDLFDPFSLHSRYLITGAKTDFELAFRAALQARNDHPYDLGILSILGDLYIDGYSVGHGPAEQSLEELHGICESIENLDATHSAASWIRGASALFDQNIEDCALYARKITRQNGNDFLNLSGHFLLGVVGKFEEAWAGVDVHLDEFAQMPSWVTYPNILYAFEQQDYFQAYEEAKAYGMPDFLYGPLMRASALGHLGRKEEAEPEVARLLELYPEIETRPTLRLGGLPTVEFKDHVLEGVRRAGLDVPGY
ncbi:MAG: hypothetical protein V3V97_12290, partial [Hyphomicrobiaceae bacterium]